MINGLSLKDRLILANQYEILSQLTDDDHESNFYENLRDVFANGYSLHYSLATEWFPSEMSNEECRFVHDVLNMYRGLYFSRENNDEIKDSIEERKVLFKGFDLNDDQESRYYSFCKFLVENLGKYEEIKELIELGKIESLNSHGSGPSMVKLKRMLEKTKEMDEARNERHDLYFTKEEVEEIINA